jgi:hypothetical protein
MTTRSVGSLLIGLLALATAAQSQNTTAERQLISKLSISSFMTIAQEMRYPCETLDKNTTIDLYAAFAGTKLSLESINSFNENYGGAYLDMKRRQPVLTYDLDLDGGVTRERVESFILKFLYIADIFRNYCIEHGSTGDSSVLAPSPK